MVLHLSKIWEALIVLWASSLLVSCAAYIPGARESKIVFTSKNISTFKGIVQSPDSNQHIPIDGRLYVPKKASGKVPAAIILHGVSGVQDDNFEVASALNKIGVAALIFDSNEARHVGTDADPTLRVSDAMRISDAFGALHALQRLPDIDPERVAAVGFSRGGLIAILAASEKIKQSFSHVSHGFAAHIAIYPVCHVQLENPDFTGAPILLLLGEKDNITPAQMCTDYFEPLKEQNYPIDIIVYEGAYHGFTDARLSGKKITHPFLADYSDCVDRQYQLKDDGDWYYPYNDQTFDKCIDWNVLTGDCQYRHRGRIGDPTKARKKSLNDIQEFLKHVFELDD